MEENKEINKLSTRVVFNFHDVTTLAVEGKGKLVDYLCYQYREFIQTENNNEADLNLIIKDKLSVKECSNSYPDDKFEFYRAGDDFFWTLYGHIVILKGSESLTSVSYIHCDAKFNRMQLNMIIELFLRIRFNSANITLVHAACFSSKDKAILVPAAKSTGKTALCLNAVNSGFNFLSDDRVWLSNTSKVYAFPRYIVITKSNSKYFNQWQGKRNIYYSWLRDILIRITPGNLLKRLMKKVLGRFIPFKAVYYKLKELYPSSEYLMQANLVGSCLLLKNKNSNNKLQLIDSNTVEEFIAQVANLEWNYDVLKAISIHDMLFINQSKWHTELEDLIENERRTIRAALQGKANYCLELKGNPESTNWNNIINQLKKKIISNAG